MTPEQMQLEWDSFMDYPTTEKTFVTTTTALLFARHIADEIRKDQEAENESLTESLAKCRGLMPSDSLDRVGSNLLNCACSRTDCVADYIEYSVAAMKTEIESLRAGMERAHAWMENQSDAQSKGGHATFDLMMLREERDAISDTLKATNPAPAQPVDDGAVREVREVMRLAGDYAIAYHEDVCLDGARKLLEAAIRKLAGGGV